MIEHLSPYSICHLHDAESVKCVGKGTFGNVVLYKCKEKNNNKVCDKQFIVKYINNKIKKCILNEYTIGIILKHKNIRETIDVDLINNSIIFEFCPGIDMFTYLTSDVFDFKQRILYFKQIVDGLEYMHNTCIAHMDLKLENIIINQETKTLKIIDFGQSKVFHDTQHIDDIILETNIHGSIPYIAPEEFEQELVGYNPEKVDIWSLCVILYEIIYDGFPWKIAKKDNNRYILFYDNYVKYKTLNKKIFPKNKITNIDNKTINNIYEILKQGFNPEPDKRCDITYIKGLINVI